MRDFGFSPGFRGASVAIAIRVVPRGVDGLLNRYCQPSVGRVITAIGTNSDYLACMSTLV